MKNRILSLLLAALLCLGLLPTAALAEDPTVAPAPYSEMAKHYVCLVGRGGVTETSKKQVTQATNEDLYALPECPFEKAGYTFAGWSADYGSTVTGQPGDTLTLTNQVAFLYAMWEKIDVPTVMAGEVLAQGDTEHRVHWTLYADGTLYLKANDRYGYLETNETPWQAYKNQITSLVIEISDNLNSIPTRHFYNMDSLVSVTVNGSLRDIDNQAFQGCDNLTEVNIHGNMGGYEGGLAAWGGIGDNAFEGCGKLERFNVDGVIANIRASAFYGCNLYRLDAPVLGDIGNFAFMDNKSLSHISPIRGSVGENAFYNDSLDNGNGVYIISRHSGTNLGNAFLRTVAEQVESDKYRGAYATIYTTTYYNPKLYFTGTEAEFNANYTNNSGTSITAYQKLGDNVAWTLEDGVLTIDGSGDTIDLLDMTEQPWVNIPGKGTWDEQWEAITKVRVKYGIELGEHMLDGLEDRVEYIYDRSGTVGDITWNITGGVLTVSGTGATPNLYQKDDEAWMPYRDEIRQIVIEEGITAVDYASFMQFPNLETVTFPNSVTQLATGAFYECPRLDQVSLPENLTRLSDSVFSGCSGLKTVYIPKSVTSIGSQAFQRTGLTDVYYGGTTRDWAKLGKGEVSGATVSIDGVYNVMFHPSAKGLSPDLSYPPEGSPFADVASEDWFHDAVDYAYAGGYMRGTAPGIFSPEEPMTRAMAVTVLHRLAGEPEGPAASFPDVAAGSWYGKAVGWAAEAGIVKGYETGEFGPEDNLTREQLATLLYRYEKTLGRGFQGAWDFQLSYDDAGDISPFADEAMRYMVMKGIFRGRTPSTLNPLEEVTRAEMATILMRYLTGLSQE